MEKKVALVLALMLVVSVLVSAEEAPTIGHRIDTAVDDVTNFFNEHAGPAVDSVKSLFNWFGDKAKEWGL